MATPIYPATSNQQAIDLNISNANQFFTILQGGIEDFIPTYEGNGEIPSVAKALNEAAAYKVPIAWETTGEETDLLQPRIFNDDVYVPLKVPAEFSTAPSNEFWRLYSEKRAHVLIDNITLTGDGFTTDFNVPSMVVDDPAAYLVSIDGVDQRPTIDYTVDVATDTLSFTEAPPTTVANNISVTILGALRGAIAEDIYETTADGLANTSDGQFFNVVNTSDPEAFIDLYRNNAGAALLIDTYPNSVAYSNLANAVAYEADLASNAVGDGSDLVAHTGTTDTMTEALNKRTIYVGSVAEGVSGLTLVDGQAYNITGWHSEETYGGGLYRASTTAAKSLHDGGKYISPTVPPVSAQTGATLQDRIDNFNAGVGETDASGSGILVNTTIEFRPENYGVFVYNTKADAVAGNDSSSAFMHAVAASRGVGLLELPEKKFINVGAGVSTQSDGFYASSYWKGNYCSLVRTAAGTGLKILGGAAYQEIFDVEVLSSDTISGVQATYDSTEGVKTITPDAEKTGVLISGARVNCRISADGHQGFNYHVISDNGNSNACDYELYGSNSGACGLYVEGTQDNLSVSALRYRGRASQGPVFWITDPATVRQWTGHIYVENGLIDQSTPNRFLSQCYLGGASGCDFWIYSETVNQSSQGAEIVAGTSTVNCSITSARQNTDQDLNSPTPNRWRTTNSDISHPFSERTGRIYAFRHRAARIGRADEHYSVDFLGNDGSFGGLFAGGNGIGFTRRDPDDTNIEFETGHSQSGSVSSYSGGTCLNATSAAKGTLDAPVGFSPGDVTHTDRAQIYTGAGFYAVAGTEVRARTIGGGNKATADVVFQVTRPGAALTDTFRLSSEGDIELYEPGRGMLLRSPSGTRYRISVDDAGTVVTTAV